MKNPIEFYKKQLAKFEQKSLVLKKKLSISSLLRLICFLGIASGVYIFFNNTFSVLIFLGIGVSVFIYLVFNHNKLRYKYDLTKALAQINKTEIKVLNRDYNFLNDGAEYINPKHEYSFDIDLFGNGSFFQYCNRTSTQEGKNKFVFLLFTFFFTILADFSTFFLYIVLSSS